MIQNTSDQVRVGNETDSSDSTNQFERDQSTDSIYAALINRIHTSAVSNSAASNSESQQTLMVGLTSSDRGEGVTTVAANLAQFCADVLNLKTLMVDASSGERLFESMHGMVSDAEYGLRQVLDGSAYLSDAIQASPVQQLDYLSSGISGVNGNQFSREGVLTTNFTATFNELRTELNHRYQIVIVDLPPAGGLATGTPIANQLDAVILVVQPGKTRKEQASAVSGYLAQMGVNVIGVVANRAETELPPINELVADLFQIAREGVTLPITLFRAAAKQWHRLINR